MKVVLVTNVRGVEVRRRTTMPAFPVVGTFISDDAAAFGGDQPQERARMRPMRVTEVTYDIGVEMAEVRLDCGDDSYIYDSEPQRALEALARWRCMGFEPAAGA